MFSVRIPATTANMGSGFDSIGMALELYNYITIEEIEKGFEIISSSDAAIPTNEKNLIYKTMKYFFEQAGINMPAIRITQDDKIPLTRGLGSSAACIVGGLLAADRLAGTRLEKKELAKMAADLEGHPDNSTPAIFGGLVVSVIDGDELFYEKIEVSDALVFNALIPDFTLSTEKAREAIPKTVELSNAVFNISRAALLIAAFASHKTECSDCLWTAMDDSLHQPYRLALVPGMKDIFSQAKIFGARAAYLSGAGPTIIAISDNDSFKPKMRRYLSTLNNEWNIIELKCDLHGAVITNINK